MQRIISLCLVVLFCFASFSSPIESFEITESNTIYVDDDNTEGPWDGSPEHPYQFIQDGIDASVDLDTIFVYQGTYDENIVIEKQIRLLGEGKNKTIIDGKKDVGIIIRDDCCEIEGFTIYNVKKGISVIDSDYCLIGNNLIENAESNGIYIVNSNHNVINSNTFRFVDNIAILIETSNHNVISSNTINNNYRGIYVMGTANEPNKLIYCQNTTISNNIVGENRQMNIFCVITNNTHITKNIVYDCDYGISIGNAFYTNILKNEVVNNELGISLEACYSSEILQNNIFDNIVNATFLGGLINQWDENYWNITRPGPVVIQGGRVTLLLRFFGFFVVPWFNIDRHPAKEPYQI